VCRASYGLPLFLIVEIPEMREQYRRRREINLGGRERGSGLSLHLTGAWNDTPPSDPVLDREGKPIMAGITE
jgi:hypothetical protein